MSGVTSQNGNYNPLFPEGPVLQAPGNCDYYDVCSTEKRSECKNQVEPYPVCFKRYEK